MDRKWIQCLIALGAIAVLAYAIYDNSGDNHQAEEPSLVGLNAFNDWLLCNGFFHSSHCVPGQQQVYLPMRYPSVTGGNISCLIHRGYDRLLVPTFRDSIWTTPPAEMEW